MPDRPCGAAYRSPSTGRYVRAVLFDTFGTVVDWRTGIASAVEEFARRYEIDVVPEEFADAWRARYQPAMQRVRSGERPFVDLDTLHRENLDEVLRASGVGTAGLPAAALDGLARAWRWLPPWPDSVPGIAALKSQFVVGPLSNANTALLVDMAKYGGLPWDVVLGSDVSRAYKPDPAAYRSPATMLGIDEGELMLVAAHNGDLAAARAAGLATGFVARPSEHGRGQTRDLEPDSDWDVVAGDISALAAQLCG
ncbi:MAG TPA: haloacid dehalogenase type II [Mycobacterium sp.]|nr:haloacid dehalogenase type II [Mycobacterium sp.]